MLNHNIAAMSANRNYNVNVSSNRKSAQRLSSGYKINQAADNAAGLSISEKMRSQIRGLDQAALNAQDGISLVQTADGALNADHAILQRMRELSVQAANDTNTEEDRQSIQDEIDQLSKEIDRIADQTEFNTRKLLDGSFFTSTDSEVLKKIMENLKGSWINDALNKIQDTTGLTLNTDSDLYVEFGDLGTNTIASMGSYNGGDIFYLNINTYFLTEDTSYGESGPEAAGLLFDRLITHEVTHAVMRHNAGTGLNIPLWFSEGLAEAVHGASDYRFSEGNPIFSSNKAASIIQDFDFVGNEGGYNAYPGGYLAVNYLYNYSNDSGATFRSMLDNMDSYSDFDALVNDAYGKTYEDLMSEMKQEAAADINDFLDKCKIDFTDGAGDVLNDDDEAAEDIIDQSGTAQPINANTETITVTGSHAMTIHWPDISMLTPFQLQVGANAGQFITLSIGNMSSDSLLGMVGLSVMSQTGAEQSITTLDKAINTVSRTRASLGAINNRLEHIITNLNNTSENTANAEARIRDTDMAAEMVSYSKTNILLQASQAMIAQANQQPDFILQLLNW